MSSLSSLSRIALVLGALLVSGAASCTESFEGGAACPLLCASRSNEFRDTVLDAVVLDTSVRGFPELGLNGLLLLANRGDTVQTRAVLRYDDLRTFFIPNNTGTDTATITAIDSVYVRLALDTTGTRGTSPVLLEAFDVDTTASDSVAAVVQSLFRPDRLIGSVTITPSQLGDSLRVPLDRAKVLARLRNGARLRVGLRLASNGQLRILAFALGSPAPLLSYDPSTDTLYAPIRLLPSTTIPSGSVEQQLSYTVYSLIERATPNAGTGQLIVGGLPSSRTYLRFNLPRAIIDSSTIVRAELLMVQAPSPFARASDSLVIEPLVPISSSVVTDIRRILELSALGAFVGLDTTKLSAANAGPVSVNVLGLVRNWRFLPQDVPRGIGLRISREGSQPLDLRFVSTKGATTPAQRPRLRITYLPRAEFALP